MGYVHPNSILMFPENHIYLSKQSNTEILCTDAYMNELSLYEGSCIEQFKQGLHVMCMLVVSNLIDK